MSLRPNEIWTVYSKVTGQRLGTVYGNSHLHAGIRAQTKFGLASNNVKVYLGNYVHATLDKFKEREF